MRKEIVWIEAPFAVQCLRKKHQKFAHYVMVKTIAVEVPSYTADEAPEVVTLSVDRTSNGIPFWITSILRAEDTFLAPMEAHPIKRVEGGLKQDIESFRVNGHGWMDWPFTMSQTYASQRSIEVYSEDEIAVKTWKTDVEALEKVEAQALSRQVVKVGDRLHLRRGRPEIEVTVSKKGYGDSFWAPSDGVIRIILEEEASWGIEDSSSRAPLVRQRFSILQGATARKFTKEVARLLGCRVHDGIKRSMEVDGPTFERNDYATFLGDAAARFPWATAAMAGRLDRRKAEAWLDLRDIALEAVERSDLLPLFEAKLTAFFFAVRADSSPHAKIMAAILQYDLIRIGIETNTRFFTSTGGNWRTLAVPDDEAYALALAM